MIYSIITIGLAFCWLLYETKFLTIRLPYGRNLLMELVRGAIAIYIGISLIPSESEQSEEQSGIK